MLNETMPVLSAEDSSVAIIEHDAIQIAVVCCRRKGSRSL